MALEREFLVIAIHGEGDRNHVNTLQNHRNQMEIQRLAQYGKATPELEIPADEPPDVLIVLRDEHHTFRLEWPVHTWEEVEQWKKMAGYDAKRRQWKHGATVKVKLGG